MGFFSWITSDTEQSIPSHYSEREPLAVKMLDDQGREWLETNYAGYGIFGGMDYYELVAKMNPDRVDPAKDPRDSGINIAFHTDNPRLPKLVSQACSAPWDQLPNSEICPNQGFFYGALS